MATKTARLFQWAAQHKELGQRIDKIKTQRAKVGDKIVKALQQEDIKTLKGDEWQVTLSEPESVSYDIDKALKVLGPSRFKKVTRPVIDANALHDLVEQGVVTVEELERFSEIKPRKPYVTVTPLS